MGRRLGAREDAVRQTTRTEREDAVRKTTRTEREDGARETTEKMGRRSRRSLRNGAVRQKIASERDGDSKRRDCLWFHRNPDQRRERQNRSGAMRECHVGASYQF
ncbi:hypothetical protein DY000_02060740 [Brassica cretica]|uniref:Uncharacterized protein n=1 Tax=Brassica cretica TaxID=69181 RepID=A0ABQ7B2M3_BRACR|nr:hypothetical protein DY000_02060740 [Brassica cretica]